MRKLSAAGFSAAGVLGLSIGMSLGLSLPANAATTVYDIDGSLGKNEHSCTQITHILGGTDCTYGSNWPASSGFWTGPLFGGGHYAIDGVKDKVTYIPTFGVYSEPNFIAAADDGKLAAPITGTLTIDDNGTPGDPTDDLISGSFSIGEMARNIATGQSTRAVERWTTMDHVIAPTPVNATATVANGAGGVDYVIGSRGFPAALCNRSDANDCFPTSNASNNATSDYDSNDIAQAFWTDPGPNSTGVERSGELADPAFTNVQPPPNPPTGNVGATTTATFTGYSCESNNGSLDDCLASTIVWGAAEDPGFDNMVMKISTDSLGAITSATVYWTQEYFIGAFGGIVGYDNSVQYGTFTFTGLAQGLGPNAKDFAASVLQGSTGNTLDTVTNSVNFADPVTVTIVTPPTLGTATVNGDNTLNYDSTGAAGTDTIVYEATDGTDTDQGTITITVAPDIQPVAPDGTLTTSTQGSAPASSPGTTNLTTLVGYSAGNTPSTVTISTQATNGTATVSGTTVTYTPGATFFTGSDSIGYTITDNDGDTDSGVLSVTIADVSPVLNDGSITTDQDQVSAALSLGITPGNGSVAQHTLAITTAATNGTCALSGTSLTYTPAAGYFGPDSCVITITDGNGDADTGTFTVTVNEVSDALKLPGGGSAVDLWSLSLLGALPLLRRRRRA